MGLLGSCLTFPTEQLYYCLMRVLVYLVRTKNLGITYSAHSAKAHTLRARADSNWSEMRSTTGYVVMLAGAVISFASRRQHCISMSSCEAELVALADLAIDLLYVLGVLKFVGYEDDEPITMRDEDGLAYFVRNGAVVKAVCSICRSDKHLMSRHPGPCPLKDDGCPGMNAPNGDPITPHRDMCKFKYKGPRTPRPGGANQRARAPGAFRRPQASLEAAEAQPPAETAAAAVQAPPQLAPAAQPQLTGVSTDSSMAAIVRFGDQEPALRVSAAQTPDSTQRAALVEQLGEPPDRTQGGSDGVLYG